MKISRNAAVSCREGVTGFVCNAPFFKKSYHHGYRNLVSSWGRRIRDNPSRTGLIMMLILDITNPVPVLIDNLSLRYPYVHRFGHETRIVRIESATSTLPVGSSYAALLLLMAGKITPPDATSEQVDRPHIGYLPECRCFSQRPGRDSACPDQE